MDQESKSWAKELWDKHKEENVSYYYTEVRGLWKEVESLSSLPPIITLTSECFC